MKLLRYSILSVFFSCVALITADAANFTTAVQQPGGQNWNGAIWQPGAVAPTAGNTYECVAGGGPTRIRNPASAGVQTFPGDSLTMDTGSEIRAKQSGATLNFPGVGGNAGLILNGGNMDTGDNAVFPLTGVILVQANSSFSCGDSGANNTRGWQIAAQIKGTASLTISKNFFDGPPAVELTGVNNPYSGDWTVNGGIFKATSAGSLGCGGVTINPGTAGATFEPMYDVQSAGALTLAAGSAVMILHQNCTFSAATIAGTSLSAGTHDYTELLANFPSSFAGSSSGSITIQPPSPPPAPTGVTATSGDGQVILSWAAVPCATSYNVKRSLTSGGPYTTVGTPTGTSFVDSGLVNGVTYYYVISAVNSGGEGPDSVEVIGRPSQAVTGLTATGGTGQVALGWNPFIGATSYNVKRAATSGGPYTTIATGVITTSYTDTMVQSGRTYCYIVTASLVGGSESSASNEACGTTTPGAPRLGTSLYAATVITVRWTNDPVVSQVLLESSTDGVNFTPLATVPANQGYTNTGLTLGTTYYYRAKAQNATGGSGYSTIVSNTTPTYGINVNFANAINGNPANNPAPTPPGYLQDVGNIYGDRGNGYIYGWDRDITTDGRWRMSANAPDLRWDTFMHLIKATPPAIWNIAIPNGFYSVHIVAGDPNNTDSVFQFDVEGVLTGTVTPGGAGSVNNNWGEFTVNTCVTDGQLTIKSGPNSQTTANNNKIGFIDIYPAVAVPPVIGTQPQNVTAEEYHPASLSVSLSSGSPPFAFQWYLGANAVPGANSQTLSFPHVRMSDAGQYTVQISNCGGSVTSMPATLSVYADTNRPTIVSVGSLDGINVGICFSEEMDNSNFAVNDFFTYKVRSGGTEVGYNVAIFRSDQRSVLLQLNQQISGSFTVDADTSQGLKDLAGNAMLPSGAHAIGVVGGYLAGDIGSPMLPGSHFTCDGSTIEIVGGGADIWGNADQGYLVTGQVSGDFDAKVRVVGLAGSNAISKAVLVAREDSTAAARAYHISVNPPPPGRDQTEMGLRSTVGGATAAVGSSFVPAGVPNFWMRMTRIGDIFTGYRSSNGVNWIPMGTNSNVAMPVSMQVGLGVTAHDNTLLATGTFSNFHITWLTPGPVISGETYSGGTFTASFPTINGVSYTAQFKNELTDSSWTTLTTIIGTGSPQTFTDPGPTSPTNHRIYRVFFR